MRKYLVLVVLFLGLKELKASPQAPDFLIIGKDTFSLYSLPLHKLDSITLGHFFAYLRADSSYGMTTNLWRGYQAYWQLEDGKLYLTGFRRDLRSGEILRHTFPGSYQNGRV
ncbi:MAG TPA: hypothetical protein VI233_02000, partial [Puia sp.]